MQWYYTIGREQKGPIEEAELFRLASERQFGAEDFVWNSSMGGTWVKAGTVVGLCPSGPAVAPVAGIKISGEWTPQAAFHAPTSNRELMAQARERLSGKWGLAVGVWALCWVLSAVMNVMPVAGPLLFSGPLALGIAIFFLTLDRGKPVSFDLVFQGFKRFGTALIAYLLMTLFVVLWSLLLIVPGIIAALSYAMTFYIIVDNPGVGPFGVIQLSKQAMRGNRWKYFCLQCRFIGWALLCFMTLGIGFLWLGPYMAASKARFYEDLRVR
jgi:uncharacterized membrane protein